MKGLLAEWRTGVVCILASLIVISIFAFLMSMDSWYLLGTMVAAVLLLVVLDVWRKQW